MSAFERFEAIEPLHIQYSPGDFVQCCLFIKVTLAHVALKGELVKQYVHIHTL